MNKIYFLVLLFFNSQISLAQEYIEVFAIDCRTNEERELNEVEIFHANHSHSSRYPGASQKYDGFKIYDDFEVGTYYIEYKSIFGRIERKKFEILKGRRHKINLCMDQINHNAEKYHSIIEQLKNGEKYRIKNTYRGSFDYGTESIEVSKVRGEYFVKFKNKQKKLSKKDVELFKNFEIELNIMKERRQYCSWSNSFLLSYKKSKLKMIDTNCSWGGWPYLVEKLGWVAFEANKT